MIRYRAVTERFVVILAYPLYISPMSYSSRQERFSQLFPSEPTYRFQQVMKALFQPGLHDWMQVITLPHAMREILAQEFPWVSYKPLNILESSRHDTYKTLLEVSGGGRIETVLMLNPRNQWTICVSSQIGCAMGCRFCATGKMGLIRNLSVDEIVDQYRFWRYFLDGHQTMPQRISNVVFMGMGEPLGNYENVKETLHTWLNYTDLGPTRITVSTVGILPNLERILNDANWPHVRLVVSLHSADQKTRKLVVPTSHAQFLTKLREWAIKYLKKFGNRRHHLTFEYVMLNGVNDTEHHARTLASYVNSIGDIKVNLIPYNFTGIEFQSSVPEQIDRFMEILKGKGIVVTTRKTMGDDIAAACGQLAVYS